MITAGTMAAQSLILTVSQLNKAVAGAITRCTGSGGLVMVRGEISGCRVGRGVQGQSLVFFTLKEGDECLSCISFGRSLRRLLTCDSQTGEVYSPPREIEDVLADSHKVICQGTLGTYSRHGSSIYQLNVWSVTNVGTGVQARQLRELKEKLARLGYFSEERKRPLPVNPQRVALVTSKQGAVIHDFLQNASDRGLGSHIRLYPVRVQGEGAAEEIAATLRKAAAEGWAEVLVLIRGGGSADDLACFDDAALAKTIFESPIPILAGIGHEVDYSLADMTADVRASTPTKAAQLLWCPRSESRARLAELYLQGTAALRYILNQAERELVHAAGMLSLLSPEVKILQKQESLSSLCTRVRTSFDQLLVNREESLYGYEQRFFQAWNVQSSLNSGQVVRFFREIRLRTHGLLRAASMDFGYVQVRLKIGSRHFVEEWAQILEALRLRLEAVSPLQPLKRGFAIIRKADGRVARTVVELQPTESVFLILADGQRAARIEREVENGHVPLGK